MRSPKEIRAEIARKESEIHELLLRYGHGVRPAWVSTELAIAERRIENLKEELKNAERDT